MLRLTDFQSGVPIYVKPDAIIVIHRVDVHSEEDVFLGEGTMVSIAGIGKFIKESPKEVIEGISKARKLDEKRLIETIRRINKNEWEQDSDEE